MRVPADFFRLFLQVDTVTGRFGTLLAAVHTIAQALLTAVAVTGGIRWRLAVLARYGAISLALALAGLWGSRLYFEYVVPQGNRAYQQLVQMDLAIERAKTSLLNPERIEPLAPDGAGRRIAAIQTRGTLRVGYPSDRLPWVFANAEGRLVGLDVDLAHLLAADLGVGLEFVNVAPNQMGPFLDDGRVDIVVGGLAVTPNRALRMRFTEPYMDATLAFVVRDHDRRRFATVSLLRQAGPLRVATPEVLYYDNLIRAALQDVQLISIESHATSSRRPRDTSTRCFQRRGWLRVDPHVPPV